MLKLSPEEKALLEKTYDGFARNGANLPDEDKEKLRRYSMELSSLTLRFSQNHLKETNKHELILTEEKDLNGLPASIIEAAAHTAKEKGKDGTVILTPRTLRERYELLFGNDDLKDVKKDEGYTRASLDLKARLVAPQHDFLFRKSATHHHCKSNINLGSEQNALLLTEAEFNEVCEGTPNPEELKKLIERFLLTLLKQVQFGSGFFIENLVILDERTRSISSHKVEEFLANHGIGTNLQKMVFRMKRDLPNIDFDPNSHCLKFDLGSLGNEKESGCNAFSRHYGGWRSGRLRRFF